jgi:uncharacterized protein YjbI with pentapeptide repeats
VTSPLAARTSRVIDGAPWARGIADIMRRRGGTRVASSSVISRTVGGERQMPESQLTVSPQRSSGQHRRTFVPLRPATLEAHRWWVLGGQIGTGRLRYTNVDLRGVWLAAAELSGLVLSDVTLDGASFESSRFDGADLYDCHGGHVDLRHVSLRGAVLQQCHLPNARLDLAFLVDALLLDCDLSGSSFDRSTWRNAQLQRVDLRRTSFTDVALDGACFRHCDLRGARFLRGTHAGTRFEYCDLDGATWDDGDFTGVKLVECRGVIWSPRRTRTASAA